MADLFGGSASSGDEDDQEKAVLKTNNAYARKYDEWRRKEELMKAKARYGSDLEGSSSEDSSDAETEDEEANQWTSQHEKRFLATLSALKGRDPKIYNQNEVIFGEVAASSGQGNDKESPTKKISSPKKMTLKDYERKIIAEEGGVYVDEEGEPQPKTHLFEETEQNKLAYDEEQRALRDSLKAAAWADDEAEDEGLVTKKERGEKQEVEETEDYVRWLKGETDRLADKKDAKELANLKKLWSESGEDKLDEAEKFLRDYVLNKRYLTAKERDFKFEVDLSEDEKDLEEMTEFEHKYNFRFEDPDPEFIKRYPRTIENSMRRKDTRRADKKAEKKARQEQERAQMREEVNRLKSMKKKEILDKIGKLKTITGSEDIAFEDADIDGDFDPEEHDRRMASLFASYDNEVGEDVYPELPEDQRDLEDLRWENWDEERGEQVDSGDEDAAESRMSGADSSGSEEVSDQDEPGQAQSSEQSTSTRIGTSEDLEECEDGRKALENGKGDGIERNEAGRILVRGKKSSAKLTLEDVLPQRKEKKRKKSKFAEVLSKSKPTYDPERDMSFEKYFDEYYKLDFEDVVGGMPTRFKYRQVVPNDFGLSTEEVLSAQDKELNKWCTLKKMVQFRSEEEEKKDLQVFSNRRNHLHLKKKILTSVYTPETEKPDAEVAEATKRVGLSTEESDEVKKKSKSRKNKKKKQRPGEDSSDLAAEQPEEQTFDQEELEDSAKNQKKIDSSGDKQQGRKRKMSTNRDQLLQKTKTKIEGCQQKTANKKRKVAEDHAEDQEKCPDQEADGGGLPKTVSWDKLTPKQKKNRRNALLKKRKKAQAKEQKAEQMTKKKEKFKPLEDLQMSEARMKAYGLNPNRMKGNLVYGKKKQQASV